MARSQSQESVGVEFEESPLSSTDEQSNNQLKQEVMGQIDNLLMLDKTSILVKVLELNVQHIKQQKQIKEQQEDIKKVLDERVMIKENLIVQHDFKTNVENIEKQKQLTMERLKQKLESIIKQIKSNDALRIQLKDDNGRVRAGMDDFKRRTNELAETEKSIRQALALGQNRVKEMDRMINDANMENVKLQEEARAKAMEIKTTSSRYMQNIQKLNEEVLAKERAAKHCKEELERKNQCLEEQLQAFQQLQAEKDGILQSNENLRQSFERALLNYEQECAGKEEDLKNNYDALLQNEEQNLKSLEKMIHDTKKAIGYTEERVAQLRATKTRKLLDLEQKDSEIQHLENQLENLKQPKIPAPVDVAEPTTERPSLWSSVYRNGLPMTRRFYSKNKNSPATKPQEAVTEVADIDIDNSYVHEQSID